MSEPLLRLREYSATPIRAGLGARAGRPSTSTCARASWCCWPATPASGKSTLLRAACGLVPHFFGGEVAGTRRRSAAWTRASTGPASSRAVTGTRLPGPRVAGGHEPRARRARAAAREPRRAAAPAPAARWRRRRSRSASATCSTAGPRTLSGGELQRDGAGGGAGDAAAPAAAGRADVAARPGRGRRADRPAAAAERAVGDGGAAGRAPARALPGRGRSRARARARRGSRFDGTPARVRRVGRRATRPQLAPPAARMFSLAGLRPLPVERQGGARGARLAVAPTSGLVAQPSQPRSAAALRAAPPGRCRAVACAASGSRSTTAPAPGTALRGAGPGARAPGETVALLGRNGAGKSTLLRVAAGRAASPAAWTGRRRARRRGAAASRPRPTTSCTSASSTSCPATCAGQRWRSSASEHLAGADPRDLSGGERQRLALGDRAGRARASAAASRRRWSRSTSRRAAWTASRRTGSPARCGALAAARRRRDRRHPRRRVRRRARRPLRAAGARAAWSPTARRAEVLSGGRYFATEVARVLGGRRAGAVAAGRGAARACWRDRRELADEVRAA